MSQQILTQERLKSLFDYDPETGVFVWKVRLSNRAVIGTVAGHVGPDGYRDIRIEGRMYAAHRLAWMYVHGSFPPHEIDHIDRNPANNRLNNLRPTTHLENSHNRREHSDSRYGRKGVTWSGCANKWQASIYAEGKHHYLGLFTDIEKAASAYATAKLIHHPTAPVA